METENWIQEVLNSTNGITKVTPDDSLFLKIQNKLGAENNISTQWIWIAAASFIILLSVNAKIIFRKSNKEISSAELIVSEISNTNQLY